MVRRISLAALFLALFGAALFGQTATDIEPEEDADIFMKAVYIDRVYEHDEGYRVVYMNSNMRVQQAFLPRRWFQASGGKGEILSGFDPKYPYMEIYWRDGEFSFVRLFVVEEYAHPSWGVVTGRTDYSDEFASDTLVLSF